MKVNSTRHLSAYSGSVKTGQSNRGEQAGELYKKVLEAQAGAAGQAEAQKNVGSGKPNKGQQNPSV